MCGNQINLVQHSKYGCWCPGALRRQDISTHDIDYVEYRSSSCHTWGRIPTTCVMSMWWNDINVNTCICFCSLWKFCMSRVKTTPNSPRGQWVNTTHCLTNSSSLSYHLMSSSMNTHAACACSKGGPGLNLGEHSGGKSTLGTETGEGVQLTLLL